MRILIDTNVILDILFAREPHLADSISVLHMCEDGYAEGLVTAKSIADIYYFLRQQLKSEDKARRILQKIMSMVTVCDVTAQNMLEALEVDNADYEDAVAAVCAKTENCSLIVTRNKAHFKGTGIKCLSPEEFAI